MTNLLILVNFLLLVPTAFASSPFEGVTGQNFSPSSDQCSASKILDTAITESGVNPLTHTPYAVWTCKCGNGRGFATGDCEGGGMDESRVLLNGCSRGQEITCYSDSPTKNPAICVSGARSAKDGATLRPRFDRLYVVRLNADGYSHNDDWKMDATGCEVGQREFGDAGEGCKKMVSEFLDGADAYCNRSWSHEKLSSIEKLDQCLKSFPKLNSIAEYSVEKAISGGGKTTEGAH